jgi:hypothetical protein
MYVRTYVCMYYVCMYVWMDVRVYVCMCVYMYVCVCVCVCMYVHIHKYIHIHRMIQEVMSLLWKVILSFIVRKKVYMNMHVILNYY